uniref:Peptidase S1 domain-containing protein n=1 Tax=Globodera rostochiensis TaxID=31243 RepID=A0A914HL71_GLORO
MCVGDEQPSNLIVELPPCQPTIRLNRSGDCESLILRYKSALLSGENLAWKVAGRFRFNSFLSNQKKKCGKSERKIQISLKGDKLSIGKECFNISRNATKITIQLNSNKSFFASLKTDQGEKPFYKFGNEFFDQMGFGPFLEDYAGLWLLGLDMFPKFGQKPTQISVQTANKCGLMPAQIVKDAAACNCATFNETKANRHGKVFKLTYNSSVASDSAMSENGAINTAHYRRDGKNVFIHPKFDTVSMTHDLALIKIKLPRKLYGSIRPTCLYCGKAEEFRTGTAFATGWGQTTDNCKNKTAVAKMLMGRYVQLMEWPLNKFKNERIFVAPDTVQSGDSGSALLASNGTHFVQVAVLSSGRCNNMTNTSVVNYYAPLDKEWIENITGVHCPN